MTGAEDVYPSGLESGWVFFTLIGLIVTALCACAVLVEISWRLRSRWSDYRDRRPSRGSFWWVPPTDPDDPPQHTELPPAAASTSAGQKEPPHARPTRLGPAAATPPIATPYLQAMPPLPPLSTDLHGAIDWSQTGAVAQESIAAWSTSAGES